MSTPGTIEPRPVLSALPPAWGGPFVWLRNAVGNLVLTPVDVFEGDDKAALVSEIKAARR